MSDQLELFTTLEELGYKERYYAGTRQFNRTISHDDALDILKKRKISTISFEECDETWISISYRNEEGNINLEKELAMRRVPEWRCHKKDMQRYI